MESVCLVDQGLNETKLTLIFGCHVEYECGMRLFNFDETFLFTVVNFRYL